MSALAPAVPTGCIDILRWSLLGSRKSLGGTIDTNERTANWLANVTRVVFAVAALIGIVYLFVQCSASSRARIERAKVGDCVKDQPDDNDSPYRLVACNDPSAKYRVLQRIADPAQKCRDVAGAEVSITVEDGEICMGPKDVDQALAVNVAKEGDCVRLSERVAQRLDCSLPEAKYKVVRRLTDVMKMDMSKACKGVPGTVTSYAWSWKTQTPVNVPSLTYDVVLCLGENKRG